MWDLRSRHLYLCTPIREDLESFVEACISGGVDIVQLREKSADSAAIIDAARRLAPICSDRGVPFIINDRPDIALEVGADGVHVGQDDVSASLCRRILGIHPIVGLSTHGPRDLDASIPEPVTYISAGPVNETPTKPGRPGTGIDYVRLAVNTSPRPVFVTGGVTPDSVSSLAQVGVRHFVVVRYLTEADHPRQAATRLRAAIDDAIS